MIKFAVTKRGIAAFYGLATTAVLCWLLAVVITAFRKPRGSSQYVITPAKPTFSPTDSLMPSISVEPSSRPSTTPTPSASPTNIPSQTPTVSTSPSSQPSAQPTPLPSSAPSLSTMPSDSPSSEPSFIPSSSPSSEPSQNPTISTSPSSQPSAQPSSSTSPSSLPSLAPSTSTIPTASPSSAPSSIPTQPGPRTMVMMGESGGNILAVGAVCFILLASSTAFYLRRRTNKSNLSDQNEKYPQYGSDTVAPNKSDSIDVAVTGELSINKETNTKLDDADLEEGRGGPVSVYNKLMAGNINNIVEELFARQKQNKDTDDKQSMADSVELTPKATKPVRVISRLSPMFSPMREFSIKMNEEKRRSLAANYQKRRSMACLDSTPMMQGSSNDSDSSYNYEEEQVNEVNDVEESYEAELTNHKCEDKKALSSRNLGVSDSAAPPEPADVSAGGSMQFTYEEELLKCSKEDGGFSFREVYFDPENELYECHVPTGPLGISVDGTQLGLRVQKINPTSPLCNIVSIGDVIIAVDDVDVVGAESCVFWQLVSRRGNKHGCCLVILKI